MIRTEIINEMDVDELRNYVCHLHDEIERLRDLNFARSEVMEALQRAYNNKDYELNCVCRLNAERGCTAEIEHELSRKYEYAVPKPTCGLAREVAE